MEDYIHERKLGKPFLWSFSCCHCQYHYFLLHLQNKNLIAEISLDVMSSTVKFKQCVYTWRWTITTNRESRQRWGNNSFSQDHPLFAKTCSWKIKNSLRIERYIAGVGLILASLQNISQLYNVCISLTCLTESLI
jgi:hypothetical protein